MLSSDPEMFKTLKGKFTEFASYMLGLDKQLRSAKNDAERVKILTQMVEIQKQQIEELEDKNANLKEQLEHKEETEN